MGAELKAGKKPYKLQLVGMELGGKPIDDYAPDFWLVSPENGGDPVGFLTSPWCIQRRRPILLWDTFRLMEL